MEEGSTRRYLTESNFFDYQGLVNIEKKDRTPYSFISNKKKLYFLYEIVSISVFRLNPNSK